MAFQTVPSLPFPVGNSAATLRARLKATGDTPAGNIATAAILAPVVGPVSQDLLVYAISQSNWSKLTERNTLADGQLSNTDLTSLNAQRTRSRIAITNTSDMQLLQLGINGRSELTQGTPSEALAEGSSLFAWQFEKRSTGILNVGFYYRNGAVSEWFKKGSSLGSGYVYNTWLANCITAANDFATRGKTSTDDNTIILIHQNESGGDSATWGSDWQQILTDFRADMATAGRPVPAGAKIILFRPKTQTESGNLTQARANVDTLAAALGADVLETIGYNLQEEGVQPSQRHHYDMFSSIVEADQLVSLALGETVQTAYVSPPQTVSCDEGTTGSDVTRQAYSYIDMDTATDQAIADAQDALVCIPEGGAAAPTVTSFSPAGAFRTQPAGSRQTIVFTGTGFGAGATAKIGAVSLENVVVNSATQLTATLPLTADMPTGVPSVTTAAGTGPAGSSFTSYDPTPLKGGTIPAYVDRWPVRFQPAATATILGGGNSYRAPAGVNNGFAPSPIAVGPPATLVVGQMICAVRYTLTGVAEALATSTPGLNYILPLLRPEVPTADMGYAGTRIGVHQKTSSQMGVGISNGLGVAAFGNGVPPFIPQTLFDVMSFELWYVGNSQAEARFFVNGAPLLDSGGNSQNFTTTYTAGTTLYLGMGIMEQGSQFADVFLLADNIVTV